MEHLSKDIVAMIIFYIFNTFIFSIIGQFIFVWDDFTISYHMFTYTGLMTLCGVIVIRTYIVSEKLKEVKDMFKKTNTSQS
ncbi:MULTISPECIES: hypothetical protein [unclassified Clostridium]|uniref:hypothetical protein n=1 Tax=unclassified Clostridium TaxID=2614128 RepID=UPI000ED83C8C|nr:MULTISPECIES: hypothetical protein [unclassified Clostridium]HCQ91097.1 hypothetical protein [Clostridium sp.]